MKWLSQNNVIHLVSDSSPLDNDLVQRSLDDLADQGAVVPADGLEPLGVHVVVLVRLGPHQSGVALLVHEQVGIVYL